MLSVAAAASAATGRQQLLGISSGDDDSSEKPLKTPLVKFSFITLIGLQLAVNPEVLISEFQMPSLPGKAQTFDLFGYCPWYVARPSVDVVA